eukprot:4942623-Amphidinium_carterae.1
MLRKLIMIIFVPHQRDVFMLAKKPWTVGLAASIRSVFWTGVILFLLTYTWAILFTNEYHQGQDDDLNIRECAFNYDSGSSYRVMMHLEHIRTNKNT